jgi:pimeloyl-ACP methyl ester carboxylesterase
VALPHVERLGAGPRIVLVHGSVSNGAATWAAQRPLAERFELVVPDRAGFPPNPPVRRISFEDDVPLVHELLCERDEGGHLVGHSYGGLVSLLAAQARPELVRSLTLVEPPALSVARGVPAVDAFVGAMEELWTRGPRDPADFLEAFLQLVGSGSGRVRRPLQPELEQGARMLMVERLPVEAEPDLDALAEAPFPKLVVSGAHSPALDAAADALERRLGAERAVLPGHGHFVQRIGAPFNERLAAFVERAQRRL